MCSPETLLLARCAAVAALSQRPRRCLGGGGHHCDIAEHLRLCQKGSRKMLMNAEAAVVRRSSSTITILMFEKIDCLVFELLLALA